MTTMEGRVSEGAKWMDRHAQEAWFSATNLDDLDLSSCSECVLGQCFGGFVRVAFMRWEKVSGRIERGWYGLPHRWAVAHGFSLHPNDADAVAYSQLRDLWVTEILSRRFAAVYEQATEARQTVDAVGQRD